MPNHPRPIVAVDTETDGLGDDRLPWEIALIRREPDGATTEYQWFVPIPLHPSHTDALNIGGYFQRHPGRDYQHAHTLTPHTIHNAPLPRSCGPEAVAETPGLLLSWPSTLRVLTTVLDGATLVGAQPHFDAYTLWRFMVLAGHSEPFPPWHYRLVDVESMTYGALDWHPGGLQRCLAALGLDRDGEEHHALSDARAALAVHDQLSSWCPARTGPDATGGES